MIDTITMCLRSFDSTKDRPIDKGNELKLVG